MPPNDPSNESNAAVLEPPLDGVPPETAPLGEPPSPVAPSTEKPKAKDPRHPIGPRGPYRPRAPRTRKPAAPQDEEAAAKAAAAVAQGVAAQEQTRAMCRAAGQKLAEGLLGTMEAFFPTLQPQADAEKGTKAAVVEATARLFEEQGWSSPDLPPGWALAFAALAHGAVLAGAQRHRPALLRARDWARDKWIGWRRGKR